MKSYVSTDLGLGRSELELLKKSSTETPEVKPQYMVNYLYDDMVSMILDFTVSFITVTFS